MFHRNLASFIRHINLCEWMRVIEFRYSKRSGRVERIKCPKRLFIFWFHLIFTLVYMGLAGYNLAFGDVFSTAGFPGILCFVIFAMWCGNRWNRSVEDNGPMQLINAFLDYERGLSKEQLMRKTPLQRMIRMYLGLCELSLYALAPLNMLSLFHKPCAFPSIPSMTPYCDSNGRWTHPSKLLLYSLIFLDTWNYQQIDSSGSVWMYYLLLGGVSYISEYLCLLTKETHSVHGNSDRIRECLRKYRRLAIFEKSYNDIMRYWITAVMTSFNPACQLFSQFITITQHGYIPMPGFMYFPILAVDTFMCNFAIFSVAFLVHEESIKVLKNLRKEVAQMCSREYFNRKNRVGIELETKALLREVKSFSAMRIRFFDNYIDPGTPLVIQDLLMTQTIQLLLLKEGMYMHEYLAL